MQIGKRNEFSNIEELNYTPISGVRPTLHGELQKIRVLGFQYFWNYYKWWTIGLLFLLLVSGLMARDVAGNKQPRLLTGAVYNCKAEGNADVFSEKLAAYMGTDLDKYSVKIMLNLKCEPNAVYSENGYLAEMRLEAQITAKELDFIIGDEPLMKSLCMHTGGVSYLIDLRDVLPETLYGQVSERVIWYQTADGKQIPAAIDVSGSKMAKTLMFGQEPAYLGIISNAQNIENAVGMLEYIMSEGE